MSLFSISGLMADAEMDIETGSEERSRGGMKERDVVGGECIKERGGVDRNRGMRQRKRRN